MFYTGIGSRQTPPEICTKFKEFATILSSGWTLRSGGAQGADNAFEKGCIGEKEIYLPWKDFNDNLSSKYLISKAALQSVVKYHPKPTALNHTSSKLMARNYHQIYGYEGEPSKLLICWTPEGKLIGGTSQALRIVLAELPNCLIMNLGAFPFEAKHVKAVMESYSLENLDVDVFSEVIAQDLKFRKRE